MSEFQVTLVETADGPEKAILTANLRAFNRSVLGESDSKPITLVIRDEHRKIIAGLSGETARGWLFVKLLWVDEAFRGKDLGTKLLGMAEAEAKKRGCFSVYLDTFSFQALGFYEKRGYRKFGELHDFPKGHSRYFMTKAI